MKPRTVTHVAPSALALAVLALGGCASPATSTGSQHAGPAPVGSTSSAPAAAPSSPASAAASPSSPKASATAPSSTAAPSSAAAAGPAPSNLTLLDVQKFGWAFDLTPVASDAVEGNANPSQPLKWAHGCDGDVMHTFQGVTYLSDHSPQQPGKPGVITLIGQAPESFDATWQALGTYVATDPSCTVKGVHEGPGAGGSRVLTLNVTEKLKYPLPQGDQATHEFKLVRWGNAVVVLKAVTVTPEPQWPSELTDDAVSAYVTEHLKHT